MSKSLLRLCLLASLAFRRASGHAFFDPEAWVSSLQVWNFTRSVEAIVHRSLPIARTLVSKTCSKPAPVRARSLGVT